jgi:hypothetical protein
MDRVKEVSKDYGGYLEEIFLKLIEDSEAKREA